MPHCGFEIIYSYLLSFTQLFPSLEDLVLLHSNLLLNLKDRMATSKDELVTHVADILLQAVS